MSLSRFSPLMRRLKSPDSNRSKYPPSSSSHRFTIKKGNPVCWRCYVAVIKLLESEKEVMKAELDSFKRALKKHRDSCPYKLEA
jgi:hypothetical protein